MVYSRPWDRFRPCAGKAGRRQCSEAPRRLVRRESGQVAARGGRSAWDSRGRSIIMRIPQVTGRVRRGPGQALRAVFTGIGQMFLAADRLKEQVESAADAESGDGTAGGWSHESVRVAGSMGRGGSAGGRAGWERDGWGCEGWREGGPGPGGGAGGSLAPVSVGGRGHGSAESVALAGHARATCGCSRPRTWPWSSRRPRPRDRATKPDISVRPRRETPPQTLIVGQSPTLDRPPVANAVDGEETVDERSASHEVTDTAAAPAPVAPASEAPPTTIVIIDESLAKYEAEQAATDQARPAGWATAEATPRRRRRSRRGAHHERVRLRPRTSSSLSMTPHTTTPPWTPAFPRKRRSPRAPPTKQRPWIGPFLPDADALPVPSYDSLSLPSLRARLRNLDIDQVRMLVEYERDARGQGRRHHDVRAPDRQAGRQPVTAALPRRGRTVALETSAEAPVPVRTVMRLVGDWIGRLGRVWVEGQIAELNRRGSTVFLTLRDPLAAVSVRVICPRTVLEATQPAPEEGARVVIWAKPEFNAAKGTFALAATEIRAVGIGELLARLERLQEVARRRGPLLRLAQASAAVPARDGRAHLRPRVGRRAGRAQERRAAVARGAVPGRAGRRPGYARGRRRHRGAAAAGRRPGGRGDHHRPRRRLDRGPAAVLRRGPGPRGGGHGHAGHQRDRPRAGRAPAGPGRRRAGLDPDRRRPAGGARRGRAAGADRPAPRRGPGGAWRAGWTGSCPGWPRSGPGRRWPARCARSTAARNRSWR